MSFKKSPKTPTSESLPEGSIEDLIPYLAVSGDAIEGSVSQDEAERFYKYNLQEGETLQEFHLRQIVDSFENYYKFGPACFSSPFSFDSNRLVAGVLVQLESPSPNYAPCMVTLDFPSLLQGLLQEHTNSAGCRFAVIGTPDPSSGKSLVPDVPKNLPTFFHTLPRTCTFQPWQKSSLSTDAQHIFDSFLLAPNHLFPHFAVDSLVRVLAWLEEEHAYHPRKNFF